MAIAFLSTGVWIHHMFAVGLASHHLLSLRRGEYDYRGADRREDLQLDRHDVERRHSFHDRDAFRDRLSDSIHDWRIDRGDVRGRFRSTGS